MKIKGSKTLAISVAELWPMLQDPEVLSRIAPGIKELNELGQDRYNAISEISIGPVRGNFAGELQLRDKVDEETMTLELIQKSKIGNAEAQVKMDLLPIEEGTQINYNGSAKVSGRLATMGQRILGGVITTLSKQVFHELENIIEERKVENITPSSPQTESIIESGKKSFWMKLIDKIMRLWK